MTTSADDVINTIKSLSNPSQKIAQARFKVGDESSFGLGKTDIKAIAKEIKKNHALALELWKTGIFEAKHIAILTADKKLFTKKDAEAWAKDFSSWDIVDDCCGKLLCKTPFAYELAIEWTKRKGEFQKRAGFSLMAMLAVHDKKAPDEKFQMFYPYLIKESDDDRNFVKKAINWAIRSIGKRNIHLAKEMIALSETIREKGDRSSKWIAADAIRELKNKFSLTV